MEIVWTPTGTSIGEESTLDHLFEEMEQFGEQGLEIDSNYGKVQLHWADGLEEEWDTDGDPKWMDKIDGNSGLEWIVKQMLQYGQHQLTLTRHENGNRSVNCTK